MSQFGSYLGSVGIVLDHFELVLVVLGQFKSPFGSFWIVLDHLDSIQVFLRVV